MLRSAWRRDPGSAASSASVTATGAITQFRVAWPSLNT
jgi:hypothetical protein